MQIIENFDKEKLLLSLESILVKRNIKDIRKVEGVVKKLEDKGYITKEVAQFYMDHHREICNLPNKQNVVYLDNQA